MLVLALGLLCTAVGLVFLIGCFIRVDSSAFIERAAGNEKKIATLHSLQDAWSKLGKPRQFIASTSAYLIMGIGLLVLRYNPRLAEFWWVVPVLLAINVLGLLRVKQYADRVLDDKLSGHAEALTVIRRQIRMCITFGVVFGILVLGPNNSFKPNPLRGSA
ncbi:hypothetical protein MMG85_06180 [Pseudoxanthomonas sp. LH2527]|uniref:hypothetical protein n=1 Tax=Pseudoxanthomonas sp. LH2527 TaxID=2923249 RepID=UPI001F139C5C|nr:hypothetical protein [Pseudoxanthomonas sp. LH2527]MCH6483150.1 hypothetical protein [Pseudoxanthomonas sp. LH2527]